MTTFVDVQNFGVVDNGTAIAKIYGIASKGVEDVDLGQAGGIGLNHSQMGIEFGDESRIDGLLECGNALVGGHNFLFVFL